MLCLLPCKLLHTKTQTDTAINNLASKRVVTKNDNDANDLLEVKGSANVRLFRVDPAGHIDVAGAISRASIATTEPSGLQIKTRQYTEIVALDVVAATSKFPRAGVAVPGWSYNHPRTSGAIKVSVYGTCYAPSISTPTKSWHLHKDTPLKAAGTWYWSQTSTPAAVPVFMAIDATKSTSVAPWKAQLESGVHVDTGDKCAVTIAEF